MSTHGEDGAQAAGPVTELIREAACGSEEASSRLFALVHGELRALAASCFRGERPGHTLQPTAVVHEAWLRLVGGAQPAYESKLHFLAVAATTMRRVLVDHARARDAAKRGGDFTRVTLGGAREASDPRTETDVDVLDLHAALEELQALNPRHAQVVELRTFGGLSVPEISRLLDVSERTVAGDWAMARAWLRQRLRRSSEA